MKIEKLKYKKKPTATIDFIIGQCGSGKSTLACAFLTKYKKKGYNVYSNVFCEGAYKFDLDDLMSYDFGRYAVLWIDEGAVSGLAARGNQYKKNTTDNIIEFFQKFRHHNVEKVFITCPDFDDIIVPARNRAENIIYVRKSNLFALIFSPVNFILKLFHKNTLDFSFYRYIGQKTDINSSDKKKGGKLEKFQYWRLKIGFIFLNRYRKYFRSFSPRELPKKEFEVWSKSTILESDIPEIYNKPSCKPKFIDKDKLKKKIKEKMKGLKTLQRKNKKPEVKDS